MVGSFSHKQGKVDGLCQPNSASDLKLVEKLLISRTDSPSERRSVLYVPFPLTSLLHNLVSPFFCAQRRFHSFSTPLPVCLMLSLMSLAEERTWTCCHGVCSDRAATSLHRLLLQMQTEAFNLSLSPLSIATSLTSNGLGLPKKLNSWSSKYFSPEETQYFLQNHPA